MFDFRLEQGMKAVNIWQKARPCSSFFSQRVQKRGPHWTFYLFLFRNLLPKVLNVGIS
jgi:hypothetical protein